MNKVTTIKKMFTIILPLIAMIQLNAMNRPRLFSRLPTDIWDLIAHYLTFDDIEYEEEFIERVKKTPCAMIPKRTLTSLDDNPLYAFNGDDIYLASSHKSTLRATMHRDIKLFNLPYCSFSRDFILTIENITTHEKQSHEIDGWNEFSTDHAVIAFNKQETHLIILPKGSRRIIIPVAVAPPTTSPDKKTLLHYFQQRLVCKQILQ